MLFVSPLVQIDERYLVEAFIRASGPGGQNVNKVATTVQLRFDVAGCDTLPDSVAERLRRLAGRRMTTDGVLIIEARRFRTQERNRENARERLVALIRRALEPPRPRRPTKPTRAARFARLESKRQRSRAKQRRQPPDLDGE